MANIQLIIDYNACVEYLAKHASKTEKLSVVRDGFVCVMNVTEVSLLKSILQSL